MKQILAVLLILLAITPSTLASPDGTPETIASRFTLASNILGEERTFWVSLPTNYDDKIYAPINYPVIYVLDGIWYYPLATSLVKIMSGTGNIPQAIVVAVDTSTHRTRDLTPTHSLMDWQNKEYYGPRGTELAFTASGGADKFLAFLKTELIPHIEANYRTAPHRTLVGHSFGGLAVAHSFLTQPGLFKGYLSVDGSLWWHNLNTVTEAKKIAAKTDMEGRYFLSLADHESTGPGDLTNMIIGNMQFADILNKAPSSGLHVKLQVFDDETHGSVNIPSLYNGLRYVFEGHRFQYGWVKNKATLVEHFEILSNRFGFKYLPPERFVDYTAYNGGSRPREDMKEILAFLKLNLKNYPQSSHAHSSIGDYYKTLNQTKQAERFYKKALKLNKDNEEARSGLETLIK